MAKNKIITSQGNVQFINSKGKTINMHPMHCYAVYEDDTVSFLFIYMKEYSGQAFFASQFEDLEVNGETYDNMDDLKDAINYAFAKAGAQARTEIVEELPEDPFTNTIYLLPKEHGEGYDEYIWNEDEGWQLIGDTDIEFERYLKIDDFNPYSAATKDYIDAVSANTEQNASDIQFLSGAVDTEISAREAADAFISGAVDTLSANLSNEVQRAQNAEQTLQNNINTANARIDAEQIARANADNALSGAIDTVDNKVEALSGEVQTMGDEAIVDAEYVSSATTIDFYNADGTVVAQIDATDFIKDGMIEDVRIENGYLIIDFNTASGKQDISIPLTDIFNPANYYDKTAVDGFISDLEAADSVISGAVDNVSANLATEAQRAQNAEGALSGAIDTKLAISDFNTYSGAVDTRVTEDERVWGEALNDLNSRIYTVSGDVASKASQSAVDALNGVVTAHTANTNVHVTSAEKATWNGKQDTLSAGTNITISGNVISAEGGGKAVSGGTNISITTGETADTINCTLNLENGTNSQSGGLKLKSFVSGNEVSGRDACAFGGANRANGTNSFVIGYRNTGNTVSAFVSGIRNQTTNDNEILFGTVALSNGSYSGDLNGYSDATLLAVGNGNVTTQTKHNAFEIRQNGDIYIADTNDTSTTNWYEKPMIKLQDQLGGSSITVDTALDSGSTNPVENRVIYNKIDEVEQVTAAALNNINDRLSEDEEVTSAGLNALNDKFGGLKLMKITQAAYDALTTKDSNTLYIVI